MYTKSRSFLYNREQRERTDLCFEWVRERKIKNAKKYKGVVQINELRKTEATTCYCILYNPARHLSLPLIHIYALSRDWRWPLSRNVVSARETEREGERGHRLFNNAAGAGSLSDIYIWWAMESTCRESVKGESSWVSWAILQGTKTLGWFCRNSFYICGMIKCRRVAFNFSVLFKLYIYFDFQKNNINTW